MPYILIIDDDDSVNRMLQHVLEDAGYEVQGAPNGRTGLDYFRKRPADLLIVDILMPEKDGLETIMELREENPDVKIIAISGGGRFDTSDYLETAKLLGAQLILTKPFDLSKLLQSIKDLLPAAE